MNDQPHTHTPQVIRKYGSWPHTIDNPWRVVYGDTTVRVCNGRRTPSERLIRKATAKAIRRHDEGSRAAGEAIRVKSDLQRVAESVVSEWAEP